MALFGLYEGVAGGNTPPKFYVVICKGFVTFEEIIAIVKLWINKIGRELLRKYVISILKGLTIRCASS